MLGAPRSSSQRDSRKLSSMRSPSPSPLRSSSASTTATASATASSSSFTPTRASSNLRGISRSSTSLLSPPAAASNRRAVSRSQSNSILLSPPNSRAESRSSIMSPPRSSSSRSDVVSISRRSVVLSPGGIGIGGNNASGLGLLTNEDNIRVHCRLRPLSLKEKAQGGTECLSVSETNTEIEIITPNNNYGPVVEVFSFHRVFDADTSQEEIFNETAEPLIENLFAGYNATILAYGQTGSGKTHTMYGSNCSGNTLDGMGIDPDCGIIPRTTRALFSRMNNKEKMGQDAMTFTLKVSFIEIYNEAIRDLFDDRGKKGSSLQTREDPLTGEFIVLDVTELLITSSEELLQLMERGSKNRAVGVTNMNEKSSRSHSLFSITLLQENPAQHTSISSKLVLVDLAGSEALKKSGAEGDQVKETTSINLSLSTLGLVINSLSGKASKHIPYRNSVLTKLLKSSLGGNSKTALIIACSPSSLNASESLSTLRFGERAKTVKNKSMLNMVRRGSCSSVAESALMEEIVALQLKLKQAQEEGAANAVTTIEVAPKETLAVLEKLQARTEEDNEELRRKASEIESLNQVLECKDILLREADREMERHMRESQSLQHARDVLSYQLQESIGVNHELIRKIALIAELQELDTLRARLRAAVRTSSSHHDSIVMSPRNSLSPVGLSRQFEGTNGRVTPRTNHTLKSSCWKSVHSMGAEKRMSSSSLSPTTPGVMITPTSALVATSSPYPSPLMGPLLTNSPLPDKIPPRKSLSPAVMLKAIHLHEDKENISVQTPIHVQSSDDDRVNIKKMNEIFSPVEETAPLPAALSDRAMSTRSSISQPEGKSGGSECSSFRLRFRSFFSSKHSSVSS